jgi:hypothetical protein
VGPAAQAVRAAPAGEPGLLPARLIHPDLNENRVDDAVDIASGKSRDRNDDGVPDEAQRRRRPN